MTSPERSKREHDDPGLAEADARQTRRPLRGFGLLSGVGPLVIIVLALLGSVLIPARQTWLITRLLRETTTVHAPARRLETELESGLAEEHAALEDYALTQDTALLGRYRSIGHENEEHLAALAHLAAYIDTPFAAHLATAQRRIDAWRRADGVLLEPRGVGAERTSAVRRDQPRYDAALAALGVLSTDLAMSAALRDRRLGELERFSLISNIVLVLTAFAALYAAATLTLRERRLAALLQRQVEDASATARQEAALRTAAEQLAAGATIDDVMQRIAEAALVAVPSRGAFVAAREQRPDERSDLLVVRAVAGTGVPSLGTTTDFRGSYAEQVWAKGESTSVVDLAKAQRLGMLRTADASTGSGLAVPLASRGIFVGALGLLGIDGQLRAEDFARATILGQLAALAYERAQLMDEAIERRRLLERVITSRSRLVRGFSHDVKNPIGAADGYAALLADGTFGTLTPRQQEGIARMRRSIHDALGLIDDLHELARVETGNLAVTPESVDLTELVRDILEEYDAGATAKGLSVATTVARDVPHIESSRARVRQIASNLLSNAIKYTERGSVTVRVAQSPKGPAGEEGTWVTLAISDTGRGIPPEKFDVIFEEFRRVGDQNQAGAGLGLAMSRLLAQALGGQITVASEVGRGSTFTLWLPVRAPDRGNESRELRLDLPGHGERRHKHT